MTFDEYLGDRLTQYCPQDGTGAPLPTAGLPCYAYAYNASGQLEARTDLGTSEVTSYDYDELGGLRSVQASAGDAIAYELDAAGRRVGKRINGTAVRGWLYQDALNPVAELDGSGAVVSTFVYATMGHVPDYMVKGGQTYRIVTDHLGSVRLVVNVADGSVAQRVDYDEFGNVIADSNSGFQPFGFAGGLYDADTGLVRFGARDYDPVVGRWTSKDPILFGGGQANLYVYVGSDSVNLQDVSGTNVWWSVGSLTAVAVVVFYLYYFEDPEVVAGRIGLPGSEDGPQDAFRHCLAACRLTQDFGEGVARALGDLHERGGDTPACEMDRNNNRMGRQLGRGEGSCEDACRSAPLQGGP